MTQADIKRLMDELNFPVFNAWGYELMLKFYEHAQREAYEKAAQVCEENEYGEPIWIEVANQCAEAIRSLKEESCR